jgi:hypothetical protein
VGLLKTTWLFGTRVSFRNSHLFCNSPVDLLALDGIPSIWGLLSKSCKLGYEKVGRGENKSGLSCSPLGQSRHLQSASSAHGNNTVISDCRWRRHELPPGRDMGLRRREHDVTEKWADEV